jgi:adenylate cyclase
VRSLRRVHWRHSWLLLALALLLGLRAIDWRPFSLARDKLFDLYQTLGPTTPNSGRVVVVDINEASLARLGQWPWPRNVMADVTRRLTAAGAIVGFDILFTEPDRQGGDVGFAEAIREGRVVLTGNADPARQPSTRPRVAFMIMNGSAATLTGLTAFTGLIEPLPLLAKDAAGDGYFAGGLKDGDGVQRRLPMVGRIGGSIYPSFVLELARVSQGTPHVLLRAIARGTPYIDLIALPGPIVMPTGLAGDIRPRFSTAPLRTLSVVDVLDGTLAVGSLADQIAIVGTSTVGSRDIHTTPVGALPGVHILAITLDNILTGSLLWRPNWCDSAELAAMLVGGFVVIGATLIGSRRGTIAAWLVVAVLAAAGSYVLFHRYGWLLDPVAPIVSATAVLFAYLLVGALRRERPTAVVAE